MRDRRMQVSVCAVTAAAMPQIADGNAAARKSAGWAAADETVETRITPGVHPGVAPEKPVDMLRAAVE